MTIRKWQYRFNLLCCNDEFTKCPVCVAVLQKCSNESCMIFATLDFICRTNRWWPCYCCYCSKLCCIMFHFTWTTKARVIIATKLGNHHRYQFSSSESDSKQWIYLLSLGCTLVMMATVSSHRQCCNCPPSRPPLIRRKRESCNSPRNARATLADDEHTNVRCSANIYKIFCEQLIVRCRCSHTSMMRRERLCVWAWRTSHSSLGRSIIRFWLLKEQI